MIVAIGPVEILAFEACIVGGNHNNTPLIDRVATAANVKLDRLLGETSAHIRAFNTKETK